MTTATFPLKAPMDLAGRRENPSGGGSAPHTMRHPHGARTVGAPSFSIVHPRGIFYCVDSCVFSLIFAMILAAAQVAAAEPPLTIEKLLADGWEIAGFASGYDNRTSLILFRHKDKNDLVQCGVLFDVTRSPHTIVNCYELR